MNLAFEDGYLRDVEDPAIKELSVEYNPESVEDAFRYIRNCRKVSYYSVNFDDKIDVLSIDYGSHSSFCYIWDLSPEQKKQFISPNEQANDQTSKQADEETEKKRFAYEVLYKIKQMTSIPYDVAVAFSKILGETNE